MPPIAHIVQDTNRFDGVSGVLLESEIVFLLAAGFGAFVKPCLPGTLHRAQEYNTIKHFFDYILINTLCSGKKSIVF